jgi:hypothetical protein
MGGMGNVKTYIERVKEKLQLGTYPEVMEYIGMQKQAWTNIQNGAGVNEKNAIRIAEILGIDPIEILALSMSLKAKNKEAKLVWLKLYREKKTEV